MPQAVAKRTIPFHFLNARLALPLPDQYSTPKMSGFASFSSFLGPCNHFKITPAPVIIDNETTRRKKVSGNYNLQHNFKKQ
jgi:hypothetical protein